ncbi:unnamed protein product [Cyprideis torosa]|uniref:Uncharacterized protein n=1 Tax=Cyprideis torosa TaxID=163714 RepID=A0A7R8W6D2_9CRUS|nr:unnamed protein product [Cyprideis torosa]CAG0880899.1 unnamed protein product [Cyprideis torosa]
MYYPSVEREEFREGRVRRSDQVFVGKVVQSSGPDALEVRVRRVMKGDPGLSGRVITVTDINNPGFCDPGRDLRPDDTRMFMINVDNFSGQLALTSSPIPMTLEMVDKVYAATQGFDYVPRPPIRLLPCEKKSCRFGAECVETGPESADCICPTCQNAGYEPICAINGKSYNNDCEMRRESCHTKRRILKKHSGSCEYNAGR